MRLIRSCDYRRMPWKNGGGETVEIAISPEGAPLDAFDWRVSMAHVGSSGSFSRFPGIDRTLAVLAGPGIRLDVAGSTAVLGQQTPPFAFSGDAASAAELIDGPIDDLNVMTRRASHRHRLARVHAEKPVHLRREGHLLLVIARQAAVTARLATTGHALAAGDTILLDRDGEREIEIHPAAGAVLYVVDIWRA